ncbi:MAG: hypothetical protein WA902_02760 [Thermosynechococcaceae cyanobacterium]
MGIDRGSGDRQEAFVNQRYVFNFPALRSWVFAIAFICLLSAVGLGWLVKSFFVLLGLLFITPVIAFFGIRWWLNRNLVQEPCPSCGAAAVGLKNRPTQCPQCGEVLQVEGGHFKRSTPPGTVDVQAVEVTAQVVED